MKDETVKSLGTRLLLMFPVAMDSKVNNISADCTTHHLSRYKSTKNSQKYFGNAANVIWGGKISILLPDYFLTFLGMRWDYRWHHLYNDILASVNVQSWHSIGHLHNVILLLHPESVRVLLSWAFVIQLVLGLPNSNMNSKEKPKGFWL